MTNLLRNAYDANAFRNTGHGLIELLGNHLEKSHDAANFHTINRKSPEDQLAYWNADFNGPLIESIETLFQNIITNSVNLHSPGYLGHQVAPPLPLTALTSALMSFLNNGMAVYEMGMAANAMEKIIVKYLAAKFELGDKSSGIVTSGGTLGNLTALLAARASVSDVWKNGTIAEGKQLAIIVSEEAHFSIDRAARIMGLGQDGIIKVPGNSKFQMNTGVLDAYYHKAAKEGKTIFCVVGCSCSTSTGAFDDLQAIAGFAKRHNVWFHVDGAHGAPIIFSERYKHLLNGIAHADSLVVDFHKMMMAPSLSTAVLFRDSQQGARTFSQEALYLYQDEPEYEWFNSGKYTFECTKPASIIHTYAIMKHYGDAIYCENVDTLFGLATQFASLINHDNDFELAYEPQSNIVCFRYKCGEDIAAANREILQRLIADGKFYIVSTSIKGEFYLRTSIMNPFTTIENLQLLLDSIKAFAPNPQNILQH